MASFFISRVDTEVDRRLEEIGTDAALALRGTGRRGPGPGRLPAVPGDTFQGPRWEALVARGARVQRPLWASTSTKNPAYPDTAYVDQLIGPDTVNTMPEETIEAFLDHGTVARTVDADLDGGRSHARRAGRGRASTSTTWPRCSRSRASPSFAKSFDELIGALDAKAAELGAG